MGRSLSIGRTSHLPHERFALMAGDEQPSSRGVVYTAIRPQFVEEARISALSLRRFLPTIRILLFTDSPPTDEGPFDEVRTLKERQPTAHLDKLACMINSPFSETLFLDTETYICGSPIELFDLLDRFDMAMALERRYVDFLPEGAAVPAAFPEYNQGVIAYRQSPEMRAVFKKALAWSHDFTARTHQTVGDQVGMRIALYESALRIAVIPQEYNCRFHSFGWLNGPVRILHARLPWAAHNARNLDKVARKLNRRTVPRVFVAGRVLALERIILRQGEHFYARRIATLFRPSAVFVRRFLLGSFRQLCRRLSRRHRD